LPGALTIGTFFAAGRLGHRGQKTPLERKWNRENGGAPSPTSGTKRRQTVFSRWLNFKTYVFEEAVLVRSSVEDEPKELSPWPIHAL
jgi:hypothetical protein